MGMFYRLQFVMLLCCAAFYYKAAEIENAPPILWSGLSVLIFLTTWLVLHWATLGNLLGQAALLAAITVFRLIRSE
jgi:hypothetical protein